MRLYLLRHGEAENQSPTGKDFDKDLTEHGREQVERIKKRLMNDVTDVEFSVFCSGAKRTQSTWEIIAPVVNVISLDILDELYLADQTHLLNFLWNNPNQTNSILLIGHNNGLSDLASYLLDEQIVLPTSGLVIIDFPEAKQLSDIGLGTGVKVGKCFPVE
nr:histidine phosphatase family protein [uncultured Brumimicrobium sp.]